MLHATNQRLLPVLERLGAYGTPFAEALFCWSRSEVSCHHGVQRTFTAAFSDHLIGHKHLN